MYSEDAALHINELFAAFRPDLHIRSVILSSLQFVFYVNVSFKDDVILIRKWLVSG